MRRYDLLLFAAVSIWPAISNAAEDSWTQPWQAIRALQSLQARIVRGEDAGPDALSTFLTRTGERLAREPSDVWDDARNRRALAVFALNGGASSDVRKILSSAHISAEDSVLIRGAVAHAEGRLADAHALLDPADPKRLPADLGAHVALIQASLALPANPAKALELLALARLLMPGSLVEEAALRRAMFIVSENGDAAEFADLARRYKQRFRASPYAANFDQRFVPAFVRIWIQRDSQSRQALEDVLRNLSPSERASIYALAARTSLLQGKPEIAREAALEAAAAAPAGSRARETAAFYAAVAGIFTRECRQSLAELRATNSNALDPQDERIRQAALVMADNIMRGPSVLQEAERTPDRALKNEFVDDHAIGQAAALLRETSP